MKIGKLKNFSIAALFTIANGLAAVACSDLKLFITYDVIVHPTINK